MVHIEKLILGVPALIGLAAILSFMVDPGYGVWVDRDMLRATQLTEHFQVMGAELNGSYYARTPGGAYYYLLGLLTAISKDPLVVSRLLIILSALGGFLDLARSLADDRGEDCTSPSPCDPDQIQRGLREWNACFGKTCAGLGRCGMRGPKLCPFGVCPRFLV